MNYYIYKIFNEDQHYNALKLGSGSSAVTILSNLHPLSSQNVSRWINLTARETLPDR